MDQKLASFILLFNFSFIMPSYFDIILGLIVIFFCILSSANERSETAYVTFREPQGAETAVLLSVCLHFMSYTSVIKSVFFHGNKYPKFNQPVQVLFFIPWG